MCIAAEKQYNHVITFLNMLPLQYEKHPSHRRRCERISPEHTAANLCFTKTSRYFVTWLPSYRTRLPTRHRPVFIHCQEINHRARERSKLMSKVDLLLYPWSKSNIVVYCPLLPISVLLSFVSPTRETAVLCD